MNPSGEQREAERREQRLVQALELEFRRQGHEVARLKIVPPGERRPLFCDLYDKTANTLIEAKGSVTREAVRMGIGQLYDYRRFVDGEVALGLLLPEAPRPDLLALIGSAGADAWWPTEIGFISSALVPSA